MSNAEKVASNDDASSIPATEDIINEVVDSCQKMNINKENESNRRDDLTGKSQNTDQDNDYIDEVYIKDLDVSSTPKDLEERKILAMEKKEEGNKLFKNGEYELAWNKYTEALRTCPLSFSEERAILYANRAAAKMKEKCKEKAIKDCTKALELNPNYVKAYIRRAKLYEESDKLDEALEDYNKILELDPDCSEARSATWRLPSQINERNERLKAEMLGSLKELGNKILKPFGLSTDNFKVQQDPNSGGYSINFTQNPK